MAVVNGAELARLYVDPEFHRRGIGKRLFEAAEGIVRDGGFAELQVGALVESAAEFYRSMGMRGVEQVAWEPEIFGSSGISGETISGRAFRSNSDSVAEPRRRSTFAASAEAPGPASNGTLEVTFWRPCTAVSPCIQSVMESAIINPSFPGRTRSSAIGKSRF